MPKPIANWNRCRFKSAKISLKRHFQFDLSNYLWLFIFSITNHNYDIGPVELYLLFIAIGAPWLKTDSYAGTANGMTLSYAMFRPHTTLNLFVSFIDLTPSFLVFDLMYIFSSTLMFTSARLSVTAIFYVNILILTKV